MMIVHNAHEDTTMTLLREYLRNEIATKLDIAADRVFVFFDARRERTIAVVQFDPTTTDVYFCDATSDDDDYAFVNSDVYETHDEPADADVIHVAIPDFDANDANDES